MADVGRWLMVVFVFFALQESRGSEDHFLQRIVATRHFSQGEPVSPEIVQGGKIILFLRTISAADPRLALFSYDVPGRGLRLLVSPEQLLPGTPETLSAEERSRRERTRTVASGISRFAVSPDEQTILIELAGKVFLYDLAHHRWQALRIGEPIVNPRFSPDSSRLAYVRGENVFVCRLSDQSELPITHGKDPDVTYGLAEFVAQEEMDRLDGLWWHGSSLVYQINNHSKVETWTIADPAFPDAPGTKTPYPRPGKNNVDVTLQISPAGRPGTAQEIRWDRAHYPYLIKVTPSDVGPLTITVASRDQRELTLLRVNEPSGDTFPLLVERDDCWVNVDQQVPFWVAPDRFLWTSERSGRAQLELRDLNQSVVEVLTSPEDGYRSLLSATPNDVYFLGGSDALESEIKQVSLAGGRSKVVAAGYHEIADHAVSKSFFAAKDYPADALAQTVIRDPQGTAVATVPQIREQPEFLPLPEFTRVGTDPLMCASILRPRQSTDHQRWPVILRVYGGPGYNQVTPRLDRYFTDQWIADQGFLVLSVDGRGTPNRGRAWERAIYQDFGTIPLSDQVTGLLALARKYPEIDLQRVGVTGWSFGGYLSALAVLRRPDVFRAAVAGAPVTDWLDYDTFYTERYLGLPGDEIYRRSSLLEDAPRLAQPLLLIHGTADDNVYFRHSLKLVDRLFRAQRKFEFVPILGATHMVPNSDQQVEIIQRTVEFFREHLR